MKKVINSFFVIIAAMVTFAGCAKQEIDAPATPETKTVQFFANSIETKTEFGTPTDGVYPTLWSAGDMVDVSVNFAQKKTSSEVECSDDFKSARFEVDLSGTEVEAPYTFYSVSPVDRLKGISSQNKRFYVEILSAQKPLATSVDKDAQLLFAKSSTTEEIPSSVELTYHHLTAYGKFSLTNLAAESVSSIILEAEFDIAGKWDYFLEDGSFVVRSGNGSKSITLTTSSTTDIWFACAPVDMTGQKMTLTVTTEKGNFVKVLNFPADKERKFEAGKISKFTVDMAGIEVEGSEEPEQPGETTAYYEKVTSEPTDWSGKYLLVVEDGVNKALSGISTTSTKYGLAQDVKINDAKIIASEELSAYEVVIAKASTSGAYTMAFDSSLLYWTSGNSLAVNSTESANTSWTISLDNGKLSIYNCKDSARQLLWNKNSPRFACYTGKATDAGYYYPHLYKLVGGSSEGGGETPEEPKVLESIAVSGATTNYVVGNEFKKPTVTATYNDETTADVTASATFSGYNMAVAGTYTVTVSYTEGEKTATTTYQITVVESQNLPEGIASIKSKATSTTDTEFAVVLTDAVVTYVSGSNAYIEDAEAGILIYKSGHGLKAGDKLNGEVSGKVKLYNGLREITAIDYSKATKTEGAEIPVTVLTLADLNAEGAYDKYENMRIKIVDVTVSADKQISQDDQTYALYFKNDTVTGFELGNIIDVIGYPSKYNSIQFNIWENAVVKSASKTTFTGVSDVTVKVNETTVINAVASSGAKVTYVSGNLAIATVDEDGTVTGVAEGETTITVSVPAYNGYPAAEQTCKVTVTAAEQGGGDESEQRVVTFDYKGVATNTNYKGETIDGVELSGTNISTNKDGQLRVYAGSGEFTLDAGSQKITKIELTFSGSNTGTFTTSGYSDGVWTGSQSKVNFKNSGKQARITKIVVTVN